MAHQQALFDALAAGMDSQATALAVQSLLEAQPVQETTTTPADDDDVFQCGKCKKQFTSLQMFMSHKRDHCAAQNTVTRPLPVSVVPSNNSAFTSALSQSGLSRNVSFGTVPASPLTQVTSNVVLGEEVLISPFPSVETNLHLQTSVLQSSGPFLSSQQTPPRLLTSVTTPQPHPSQQHHHQHAQQPQHQQQPPSFCTSSATLTPGTITLHPATGPLPQATSSSRPSPIAAATVSITDTTLSQVTQDILGVASRQSPTRQDSRGVNVLPVPPAGVGRKRSGDSAANKKQCKLKCNYCDRGFNKPFDLAQHVRSHTGEKPFQCIVCGRAFAQKSNVKKHMQTHKVWPGGKGPTLPEKPITTLAKDSTGSSTEQPTTDPQVTKAAMSVPEVHNIGVDDIPSDDQVLIDSSYVCQYCGHKFNSYFQLKTHMTTHKSEQVYKCIMKTCSQTFKDLDSYLEHTKSHESDMVYRCHLCSKQFPSLYDLGVHQYSHSLYPSQGPHQKQRVFRCNECKSKYATEEALEHHLATTDHHFACTHCKKVFPCERYLRRHLPTHSSQGNFECSVCNKRFKTESYLKSHHLIHTGDKPFKCTTCGAEFNRKDKLKRHNLIHDPIKRFKCPFKMLTGCTKEFNRPDKLKAHIVSHSGIKPFKCSECNKCFSRRPNLNEHMRAHKDDYDIRCEICNKGFGRKKHLEQHKLRAHKVSADDETVTVEVSLLEGASVLQAMEVTPEPPKKKQRKKSVKPDDTDNDSLPVVKTKTRNIKMLHSGFGKGKKVKKPRKSPTVKKVVQKTGSMGETDLSEIQKDLEIIRSGLQKQKEEQERLEHERASGSSEPGREKITGSTDPMPIQGMDSGNADGLNTEGQFGNLTGDDSVSGSDETIVFQVQPANPTVC